MPTPSEIQDLRDAQEGTRALVVRDLEAFFAGLDLNRPEAARDELLEFVPILVAQYGEQAASFAADWYDEVRLGEGIGGRFRAAVQDSPYEDATEGLVRRAAAGLFTESPAAALATLVATTPKYVLAAGRQTITTATARDPRASGWRRVTRSGTCRFCRMLAQRGAVYKESTAFFASHDDCNCAAVPSWDPDAPEVDVFAYEASARTSQMRMAAERGEPGAQQRLDEHNALIRRAVDEYT